MTLGIMPQYYIESNHEAIIPKELCRKKLHDVARSVNVLTTSVDSVQTTHFRRLCTVLTAIKNFAESIGTTVAKNRLYGVTQAGYTTRKNAVQGLFGVSVQVKCDNKCREIK